MSITINTTEEIKAIKAAIIANKEYNRSAWGRGVNAYALDLLDDLIDNFQWSAAMGRGESVQLCESAMLNGARNWAEYSYGGSAFVYDGDIAERLCCPSEFARCRGGERNPNGRECWLDVQARALRQAASRVMRTAEELAESRII